jgi:histidinol phosphatase-like PHP family hydrolase/predicted phosphodiesterase
LKIAIISDIHAPGGNPENPQIRGELAEMLLLRAINRFNRWIKPDVAIICGDLVDGNDNDVARLWLENIKQILEKLNCPYIAVRGNHDPSADYFYRIFERKEQVDIGGVRFLIFDDTQEPGFNASRSSEQIARFKNARADFNGPIISVQHVPLFEPGTSDCPYNYLNAEQIIAEMKKYKIFMSVSGHYHKGMGHVESGGINFIAAPAVSEMPFQYMIIETDGEKVSTVTDTLQMPPEMGLVDRHVHTQLAYCSENMNASLIMKLYKDFGLADIVFTEHSGQLYFNHDSFWTGECYIKGLAGIKKKENRMERYFKLMKENNVPTKSIGLEVDFDYAGRAMIRPGDREKVGFVMGSLHKLAEMWKEPVDWHAVRQEYLFRTEAVLKSGVNVLAHPFRLFHRKGGELPTDLYAKLIKMLKEYKTAAEMNFHSQEAESDFAKMCIESGVKLSLSSDCHNMYELGELWPHMQMLYKIGVSAKDLNNVLY